MANYANLKSTIDANVTTNGTEAITGSVLNSVLKQMVSTMGEAGYLYKGVATTSTNPGTPDTNVWYLAVTPGTYTNFGSAVVASGEVAILRYNGSWTKDTTGLASAAQVNQLDQKVGAYEDAEPFLRVYTDANDKILWAIKKDGDIFFGSGVPVQIKEYIADRIAGLDLDNRLAYLDGLVATKADKDTGAAEGDSAVFDSNGNPVSNGVKSFNRENPEYLYCITDKDDKVLFVVKNDGSVDFFGIPSDVAARFEGVDEKLNPLNKEIGDIYNWNAAANTIIFTDEQAQAGENLYFDFVIAANSAAIGFFNSSDTRIEWIGFGDNQGVGAHYSGYYRLPQGFKYAKVIWGGLSTLRVARVNLSDIPLIDKLTYMPVVIRDYFKDEMGLTIDSILSHSNTPSVVFPILTDSHIPTNESEAQLAYDTVNNVRYLCNNCYCDAVLHLGDLLNSAWNSYLLGQGKTQEEANTIMERMMSNYLITLGASNPNGHLFAIGGNHDGAAAQNFKYKEWYAIVGRKENADDKVEKDGAAPYFYVDYPKVNLRCVFLQQPNDYENGGSTTFGYTQDMLEWLVGSALDVQDGTNVVIFSHVAPFLASYVPDGVLPNLSSFYGVCNAFDAHSSFSDSVVSCDFSALQDSRLLCYVCGHTHADAIYEPGETYSGTAYVNGSTISWTYENGMPCPVVVITNTFFGNSGDGETQDASALGGIHTPRQQCDYTQDAWDVFVFNPDEKKIHFVRFGSGEDREIDLSSVI